MVKKVTSTAGKTGAKAPAAGKKAPQNSVVKSVSKPASRGQVGLAKPKRALAKFQPNAAARPEPTPGQTRNAAGPGQGSAQPAKGVWGPLQRLKDYLRGQNLARAIDDNQRAAETLARVVKDMRKP